MRELLLNVIKHAGAENVNVSIERIKDKIKVVVEDDGTGFNVSDVRSWRQDFSGFGLFNIWERLKYIDGSLDIESKDGCGTKVVLIAPLAIKDNKGKDQL